MGQKLLYSTIVIERKGRVPVFLQVCNALIKEIQQGRLRPGVKLMGVRALAALLAVNKNTIEAVYAELEQQQWIIRVPRKGTFVSEELPETKPKVWASTAVNRKELILPEATFAGIPSRADARAGGLLAIDDGFPDPRLVDHLSIGRTHRSILRVKSYHTLLSYTQPYGNGVLREVLVKYLNDTRGIPCQIDNLMITRGSQMAIFLAIQANLRKGEVAIVSSPGYFGANNALHHLGANVLSVPVDKEGIRVEAVEHHCKKHKVKLIYVTPHHHHPTTVTLSPARRMKLLHLAETYGFVILEDDYDYDFHYGNSPILPLSSIDGLQHTIYTGSFSKAIAPALRIGYLLAPKNIIEKAAKVRQVIDHQGDAIMERVMANLIQEGEVERMLRRSRKIYKQRRDFFCQQLGTHFAEQIDFRVPEGGLAIWAKLKQPLDLAVVAKKALAKRLHLTTAHHHPPRFNALRLGFASLTVKEIEERLAILKKVLDT